MIKFNAEKPNGGQVIGLVLEPDNIRRMKQGQPIYIDMAIFGLNDVELMIHFARNKKQAVKDLSPFIGPKTVVHDTTKGKVN